MHEIIARRLDDDAPIRVRFDDRVRAIEPAHADVPPNRYVAPAFVDLQVNGFGGVDFNCATLTPARAAQAAAALLRHGTVRALATLITASLDDLCARAAQVRAALGADPLARRVFLGIHLEGPFLCPEDGPRGAHPREHCRPPNYDDFRRIQDAAGGAIRLATLAPELPGAIALIERLAADGIVVALGHHQADDDALDAAVAAGAAMCTHLGNGSHAVLPRSANYVQSQLAEDRLRASFIADGFHLPPRTLKNFLRAKGLARSILVTDAIGPAAASGPDYDMPIDNAEVAPDGRVVLKGTQYLAGSTLTMDRAIANAARWIGCSRADAVRLAATNPADALARRDLGRLDVGAVADILVIDWPDELIVRQMYLAGERVYDTP